MAGYGDFVLQYYKVAIMKRMPVEQFSRYCDLVKKQSFAGNQKFWQDLLKKDEHGNPKDDKTGNFEIVDYPDPSTLSEDDWKRFFNAFQDAFRSMDQNKKKFIFNKELAKNFFNEYFVKEPPLFKHDTASKAAEDKIKELIKFINDHPRYRTILKPLFNQAEVTWDDVVDGVNEKKYNKEPKFKDLIISMAETVDNNLDNSTSRMQRMFMAQSRGEEFNEEEEDGFSLTIRDGFDSDEIDPARMTRFKSEYKNLLHTVLATPQVNSVFVSNDSSKITKSLNTAKEFIDYDKTDSDSYLVPKSEDELTLGQRISKFVGDTYNENLKKYAFWRGGGDRRYFSIGAESIVKSFDKVGLKPTDDLSEILKKASDIKTILGEDTAARTHFKWFEETLTKIQKDPTMKKTFAGALKNGRQLRGLVSRIIVEAARTNDLAKGKTALEVLSAIHYGYTTSKLMDAIRSETKEMTIFSDPNLSWNKNAGMKFVMTALDKSIRFAMLGAGYGLTIAGNMYSMSGRKFKGKFRGEEKDVKKYTQYHKEFLKKNKADKEHKAGYLESLREERANMMLPSEVRQQTRDELVSFRHRERDMAGVDQEMGNTLHTMANEKATELSDMRRAERVMALRAQEDKLRQEGKTEEADKIKAQADLVESRGSENSKYMTAVFTEATETIQELDTQITNNDKDLQFWDDEHKDVYNELMAFWDMLETNRFTHINSPAYDWHWGNSKKKQEQFRTARDAINPETNAPVLNKSGTVKKTSDRDEMAQKYYMQWLQQHQEDLLAA